MAWATTTGAKHLSHDGETMTSTTHWYDRGSSGNPGPNSNDEDKFPGAQDQWQQGRDNARQQEKLFEMWTRPDPTPSDDNR